VAPLLSAGGSGELAESSASVNSASANIALYGDIDADKTSEITLGSGRGVLLLDDAEVEYAGFGLDVGTPAELASRGVGSFTGRSLPHLQPRSTHETELESATSKLVQELETYLATKPNATSSVLVNRVSVNSRGSVANIQISIDLSASPKSAASFRNGYLVNLN